MNREAAVLGTPVWSIFEGPLGGVDELLVRQGRMRILRDPEELSIEPRSHDSFERRVRRDPADLLKLAVPV
jgi:predicted glycosyltransferase